MAFAIVTTGMTAALLLDPGAGGVSIDDFWLSLFFAAILLPAYLPTVLLHVFAVPVLSRRLPPRVAVLIAAPIAPGLLWGFVAVSSDWEIFAIAVGGTVAYGLVARVPPENPVGAVFVSLALVVPELLTLAFESYVLMVGLLLALAFLGFAVWGFHHRRRPDRTEPIGTS